MSKYIFRMAKESDAAEILNIYKFYVEETAVTFEVELPTVEGFVKRIQAISHEYPYIVCMFGGKIIGYAYAHRHKERAAYQWNAELSVYIAKEHHRCGIGRRLYEILIEILQLQNIKNVYGGVTLPNEKSERLHESLSFTKSGVYHKAGFKCGAWHDVAWFERNIGEYDCNPAVFSSIQNIAIRNIAGILEKYAK